jgi:hypothetical protein
MRQLRLLVSLFAACLAVFGQSDRGTITGTVTDPAGAVIASAPVEAKSETTGITYPAATSTTGNYTLSELPVGTYDVSVSAPGFKKATRAGVQVTAFTTFRVDFQLEVGAATETVTITGEAPLLKTESGELSHNIDVNSLDTLPILTIGSDAAGVRNPLASISLLPGASFSSDAVLRINGMPSSSQSIMIEGQDATNGFWKEVNSTNQTGVDAIQEVAVQTSNFAAEFGQAGGGYINYTMKSGTNQFHGSAFDYFVNEFLNAGTPFTNAGLTNSLKDGQLVRNPTRSNDWGGTFGGPIDIPHLYNGHDRSFFFFSYEEFNHHTVTNNGLGTVPTAAYQQGNFSSALNTPLIGTGGAPTVDALGNTLIGNEIFDPATQTTVNGQTVRMPFPNNTIPVSRFDPVAAKVQALFPQPTIPGALINNYQIPSYRNYNNTEIPTLKIDQNLSATKKLSFFYSANHQYTPNHDGYTQAWTPATPQEILSQTLRLNYDQTITPTVLMHFGAGLLNTTITTVGASYDSSQLFGSNTFYVPNQFPNITPGEDAVKGGLGVSGFGGALGNESFALWQKDTKPTFNASVTWVKGNHTFKFGGEAIFEGLPGQMTWRSKGIFGFGQAETADPFSTGYTYTNGATGFSYASYLLGQYGSLNVQPLSEIRLGDHTLGFYAQDTWKARRNLTIDYGLRYDYATLLSEEHGRMQDAAFSLANPVIGGRAGSVIYGGDCHCQLNHDYPYAFGPRLGVAYQIDKKTVLRLGSGISYGGAINNAYLSYSVPDFYTYSDQPQAGIPAGQLSNGNPFAPGNQFGNPPLTFPNFSPHYPFQTAPGYIPPESPFISIDRNAGRLPRILQYSLGIQRELSQGTLIDIAYVGNRGVWWTAPLLETYAYNALTPQNVTAFGLNNSSASSLSLLTTPIASATGVVNPAIAALFPWMQVVKTPGGFPTIPSVYPGFPATEPLNQALRPYPQWFGVPPFLGPPLGDTWYDSLQLKVTRRFYHGLTVNYAFTWQKELALGAASDTSYLVPADTRINDVFNYGLDKQISPYSRPFLSILALTYQTPALRGATGAMKGVYAVLSTWTYGAVLRYQSGQLIATASSNNNYLNEMARGASNNPALWGGGTTFQDLAPGQPLFLTNPNSHFDPTTTLVLNPAAWQDVGPGQFGTAPAYLNNYRWQRQPAESMNFGRTFAIAKEGKINLNVRAEFQNIFNRLFYSLPSATNPQGLCYAGHTSASCFTNQFSNGTLGALSSGFGFVNSVNGLGATPRSGQLVARFQF